MWSVPNGIGKVGRHMPRSYRGFFVALEKRQLMHFVKIPIGVAGQAFDGKCRSYDPGHAPHYIQLRKAFESNRVRAVWAGIELPSTVKFSIDGIVKTFSNHHPQTIQDLVTIHPGSNLAWVEEFRVLIIETAGPEGFAFNLSRNAIGACAE
jgi:hypothetical protein